MRDGLTEKLAPAAPRNEIADFLDRHDPKIVGLTGAWAGLEWPLNRERLTLGRGPGVDIPFDNPAMSRQHAAIEFFGTGFRLRDLGSTNGLMVNGNRVEVCDLEHGDRFELAGLVLQIVIEQREATPDTYELSAD